MEDSISNIGNHVVMTVAKKVILVLVEDVILADENEIEDVTDFATWEEVNSYAKDSVIHVLKEQGIDMLMVFVQNKDGQLIKRADNLAVTTVKDQTNVTEEGSKKLIFDLDLVEDYVIERVNALAYHEEQS